MKHKAITFIFAILLVVPVMFVFAQSPTPVTPTVNPSNAILPPCDSTNPNADCYTLLEALPTSDPTKDITSIDVNGTGNSEGIGGFINFAMELGIGIAGILGVVMLVVYGFQYAANDQNVGNFEVVKGKITKVVLGLMLLLGITIILRTINPDLLIVEPGIGKVSLSSIVANQEFTIQNPGNTGTIKIPKGGKIPIEQLCPIAKAAATKTNLDPYFILAILWQETNFGSNVGTCNYQQAMKDVNKPYFLNIMSTLGKDPNSVGVSCKSGTSNWGGAMGFAQITPGTWSDYVGRAQGLFGGSIKDPWNITHAIYVSSSILAFKTVNGAIPPTETGKAYAYFGANDGIYAPSVLAWKAGLVKENKCGI